VPKATARHFEPRQGAGAETDARQWEYSTYAPPGETCPACRQPIKTLESCRRGTLTRRGTSPLVAYWHTDCATKGEGL